MRRDGLSGGTMRLGLLAAVFVTAALPPPAPAAYASVQVCGDTARGPGVRVARLVVGYLSPRGMPPVRGVIGVTDSGLAFRSTDGRYAVTLPVGPLPETEAARWRATGVSLAYVDETLSSPSYFFRVDGGTFETDDPGPLLDAFAHPAPADSLSWREQRTERALVTCADEAALSELLDEFLHGGYAESLYAVFGRPARPAGIMGERGRAAGRVGEYLPARDSLALDPSRMTSAAQLRHTLAHELAHRWQWRSPRQLAVLWEGVPPIRDSTRYGSADIREQQAEAAAFAIHFLLANAATPIVAGQATALDHYEALVPGTRAMVRYFVLQPVFHQHPLRRLLVTGRVQ